MRNSIIFILFMGILTSCGQQEHSRRAPEKKAPDIEQPTLDGLLIPYQQGKKWGYCNREKKIIIPCIYMDAAPFYEGLARVMNDKYEYGFIDTKGKLVIDFKYEWAHHVYDGLIYVEASLEDWGTMGAMLNTKGEEVVPFRIETPPIPLPLEESYLFKNGMMQFTIMLTPFDEIAKLTLYENGEISIDSTFSYYEEDYTVSSKEGITNEQGDTLFSHNDYTYIGEFRDGYADIRKEGTIGFINEKKVLVVPMQYYTFSNFSEGLISVSNGENKYGFLDTKGRLAIPFQYDKVFSFSEGLALVVKGTKFGFIDKKGKTVIPFKYDYAERSFRTYFKAGITGFKDGLCPVWKGDKMGFIDTKGKLVIDFLYDGFTANALEVPCFEQGLARVRQGEDEFYIDMQGREYYEN